jgi:hypothetical protein
MNQDIISVNDKLYRVYRVIKDDPKWDLEILRTLWMCSNTFKRDGMIYFVREIPQAEYETLS